ncbi:hypothetical protein GQX73_g1756 [Xylaria multiplex]|uniref:Uncharacterized protein n=1 Tax=Xylaria multiplex TaxID=323545 RepID=A0A7C8J1S3_9PEZI|nr:hypothetical protein GQX73_g1756 [Xylaria multiplex]
MLKLFILLTKAIAALAVSTRTRYHITGEPLRQSPGRLKYFPRHPSAECRYGYITPHCIDANASCCDDEDGWVYLPRFSDIHPAGSPEYMIRASGGEVAVQDVRGTFGVSEKIALGVGVGVPFVGILVALGPWLFPGARLWFWKKWKALDKPKKDDDESRLLEEGGRGHLEDKPLGLEMSASGDLGERHQRYQDDQLQSR